MVDVSPRGKRHGEPERSEEHLSGSGRAQVRWRSCRNRLKIVGFFQASGGGRLLLAAFILQLFSQDTTTLARVSGLVLLFAEVSCDKRPIE